MKTFFGSLALLFAISMVAQDALPPYLPDYSSSPSYVEQQMQSPQAIQPTAPLPSPDDAYTEYPAVASTVTTDDVTLPGSIGTMRRDQLAHSIAQPSYAPQPATWSYADDDSN